MKIFVLSIFEWPFYTGITVLSSEKKLLNYKCYIVFSDLKDRIERKNNELESAQQKLIDAAEEEKTFAEERLRSGYTDKKRVGRDSDEDATPRG